MDFQGVRPDLVKFEMRRTTGLPAWQQAEKKKGFFGRLLSGIGKFFGAIAAPLSFVFPPAALAAAGMYGVANIGDQIQAKAHQKQMEQRAQSDLRNASFPGLNFERGMGGSMGGLQPAAATGMSPNNEMIMDVLFARDKASLSMTGGL